MTLAWYTAALTRTKNMPKLKTLLISDNKIKPGEQTDEEMLEKVKLLNTLMGGKVVEM